MGTIGDAMRAQGAAPDQRLEAIARKVMAAQPREKWVGTLLAILKATDMLALLELMRPAMNGRADEYLRSLAKAGEGEGQVISAEQANRAPPSPDQSPQGGDVGHVVSAEQAIAYPPTSQQSAPADGGEGHKTVAEQARSDSPSLPTSLQNITIARDKVGKFANLPLPVKKSNVMPLRRPNPPAVPPSITAGIRARMAQCIMDSFMIGEVRLRDATPTMCRLYVKKHRRNAVFVERIIAGVPEDRRIGEFVTDAEANALYQAATAEMNNV